MLTYEFYSDRQCSVMSKITLISLVLIEMQDFIFLWIISACVSSQTKCTTYDLDIAFPHSLKMPVYHYNNDVYVELKFSQFSSLKGNSYLALSSVLREINNY